MVKYTEDTIGNDWMKIVTGLVEKHGLVWHYAYYVYYECRAHDKILINHEQGHWPFRDCRRIAKFIYKLGGLSTLEIYGRNYVAELMDISEEIEQAINEHVSVILRSEHTKSTRG